jgi:hypothetical protein
MRYKNVPAHKHPGYRQQVYSSLPRGFLNGGTLFDKSTLRAQIMLFTLFYDLLEGLLILQSRLAFIPPCSRRAAYRFLCDRSEPRRRSRRLSNGLGTLF